MAHLIDNSWQAHAIQLSSNVRQGRQQLQGSDPTVAAAVIRSKRFSIDPAAAPTRVVAPVLAQRTSPTSAYPPYAYDEGRLDRRVQRPSASYTMALDEGQAAC